MVAYAPFGQSALQRWLFCGLAAIADALYITVLYWIGGYLTHNADWIFDLTGKRIFWIAIAGVISATFTERTALALGLWQYSDAMTQVPILQVGIVPILQFFVLPIVTFWFVKRLSKQQTKDRGLNKVEDFEGLT